MKLTSKEALKMLEEERHKDCISNDWDETDRNNPNFEFVKNYIKDEYTIYEKIINLCDLMCTTKVLTIDKRGMDLLLRHGVYAKTHYIKGIFW